MTWQLIQADAAHLPLADSSVDLVIGSPPYLDARTYGIGAQRNLDEWVAWMLTVTAEALRVSRGLVIWVCAGVTRQWCYQPGPEGLLYEWVKRGGIAWRPVYWHRVGIPGSGGKQWYRSDVEHCLAFARERGALPYGVPTANGHPADWPTGGPMSYRDVNGKRRNVLTATSGYVNRDAKTKRVDRAVCEIANPGNWLTTGSAGGGKMGHALAHESEAPYPTDVPAWFIRSHCPPGGIVLDPFGGSGTTAEAAEQLGRNSILCDIRPGKGALDTARRRLERPHAIVARGDGMKDLPLFDGA
jgi:site-specific DNA-methyltransferase (adenine-specific)